MHHFKDLKIWQKSMIVVTKIYKHSKDFPDFEKFRLLQQVCGSSVSIPSNIAEGAGRGSDKEFIQFLNYALGSSFELETQWKIALELKYISESQFTEVEKDLYEIQSMIISFKNKLKS
jgi:four helix bundle protein